MHFMLAWGCVLGFAVTFPLVFGWLHFAHPAGDAYMYQLFVFGFPMMIFDPYGIIGFLFFNALNFCSVMIIVGTVIGAVYKDAGDDGLPAARNIIHAHWQDQVEGALAIPQDAKSTLQEWAQGHGLPLPQYALVSTSGPAHAPHYTMRVSVKGHEAVEAIGASKREAEKKAATLLVEKIQKP
jgi:hypothetical protein